MSEKSKRAINRLTVVLFVIGVTWVGVLVYAQPQPPIRTRAWTGITGSRQKDIDVIKAHFFYRLAGDEDAVWTLAGEVEAAPGEDVVLSLEALPDGLYEVGGVVEDGAGNFSTYEYGDRQILLDTLPPGGLTNIGVVVPKPTAVDIQLVVNAALGIGG